MLTCANCGHPFRQLFDPDKKPPETEEGEEAKTMKAAKVNGQGPFCELCRHLEMALRYAEHRKLSECAGFIRQAQKKLKQSVDTKHTFCNLYTYGKNAQENGIA